MEETKKSFLKIFVISLLFFIPLEFLYYYVQDVYGVEASSFVGLISIDIVFCSLGLVISVISLNFFRLIKTKEEISIATFLLKPKEMTENCKLIWYASLMSIVGWIAYGISLLALFDLIPPLINKRISEMFGDAFLFVSIFFTLTSVFVFDRWSKVLKKYV